MKELIDLIFTRLFWKLFFHGITHPIQFARDQATLSELAAMHRDKGLRAIAAAAQDDWTTFRRYHDQAEEVYRAYSQEWERVTGESCEASWSEK